MGGRSGVKKGKANLLGDYYAESYEEIVNGTVVIRTRWKKRKTKKTKPK